MADNLGPLPKDHPRVAAVEDAARSLAASVMAIISHHRLTNIEAARLLNDEQRCWLVYALREERHGDASQPADIEREPQQDKRRIPRAHEDPDGDDSPHTE